MLSTTSISNSRRIQFCAGHRVVGHESKCQHLHGHNYIVTVWARGKDDDLDNLGRVIDFAVLKEKVGGWIDNNWDHAMLLWEKDPYLWMWCDTPVALANSLHNCGRRKTPSYDDAKYATLPYNPTAENMARYLLEDICPMLFVNMGVEVFKVVVEETENCTAVATKKETHDNDNDNDNDDTEKLY